MKYLLLCLLLTGRTFDICAQPTPAAGKQRQGVPVRKGYVNHTELGTLLGAVKAPFQSNEVYTRSSFTASSFNGYRFRRGLAVGATVGVDWYARNAVVPLSLGLRGDVARSRVSPFYALDAGYAVASLAKGEGVNFDGGLHLNPAIGLRFALNGGAALTWSIGYKYQRARTVFENANGFSRTENVYNYNRLALKVGMSF